MVLGNAVAYFPNSASYCDLPSRFDEVVLGKSQAITPLSERLKVDFALIDQNIANQILWLVSHALSMSRNSRQGALPVLRRRYRTAYI